jgi:hypothetical protein
MAKALSMQTNSIYTWQIAHVVGAKSQVVNGILWHLEVVGGDSACLKADSDEWMLCESPVADTNKALFTAKVLHFHGEWQLMDFSTMDAPEVEPSPTPSQEPTEAAEKEAPCMGCVKEGDPTSEEAQTAAAKGMALLSRQGHGVYDDAELAKVISFQRQVVAGMKYKITVQMSVSGTDDLSTCSFELWERDWLEPPEDCQLMAWDCDTDAEAEATSSALQVAAAADGAVELKAPPTQTASGESSGRGLVSTVAGVAGALIVVAAAAIGIALMLRRSRFGAAADMSAAAAIELPEEGGVVASQSAYTIQVRKA